jgi:hypothetical protein
MSESPEACNATFPRAPNIEAAFRDAHRALERIVLPDREHGTRRYVPEAGLSFGDVISQFRWIIGEADIALAATLGPLIGWESAHVPLDDWEVIQCGVDFDGKGARNFGATLNHEATRNPWAPSSWQDCPLDHASSAYRRETGWDFTLKGEGVWLLALAPISGAAGDDAMFYTGHLAGFAVLFDKDGDGSWECVGHVWTARAWRRRGIARGLLQEARERFGSDRIDGPYTEAGAALVRACPEFSTSRGGR